MKYKSKMRRIRVIDLIVGKNIKRTNGPRMCKWDLWVLTANFCVSYVNPSKYTQVHEPQKLNLRTYETICNCIGWLKPAKRSVMNNNNTEAT